MNDNRDEILRLRAMRAEAINRGDFGRADAIGADLARLESAAGGTIDPITGMPAASASAPSAPQGAPFPPRRDERPAQGRPAYEDQHGPAPRQSAPAPWIGYIFLDDFGRTKPAFLNSTGVMYPSVECILKLLYQCT